jgi:ABC-type iron transport system FetAB permease component
MIEIIVIIALLIYIAVSQYITIKEREKLMKLFMAKDLSEVTANEVVAKLPKQEPIKPSENIPMEDVIEDEVLFDKHIAAVKLHAEEEFKREQDK